MPDTETILQPSDARLAPLRDRFRVFARACFHGLTPAREDRRFLSQLLDEDGMLIVGISDAVNRDGLEIDILRVAGAQRRSGIGAQLLAVLAELEAYTRTQGAEIAFLRKVTARDFTVARVTRWTTYRGTDRRDRGSITGKTAR